MSERLAKMAEEIRRGFKECASISFWGGNLVRPGDQVYLLKSVSTSGGNTLSIVLEDGSPSGLEIQVHDPEGLEIDKLGSLTIAVADSLALDAQVRPFREGDRPPALRLR